MSWQRSMHHLKISTIFHCNNLTSFSNHWKNLRFSWPALNLCDGISWYRFYLCMKSTHRKCLYSFNILHNIKGNCRRGYIQNKTMDLLTQRLRNIKSFRYNKIIQVCTLFNSMIILVQLLVCNYFKHCLYLSTLLPQHLLMNK